MELRKPRETGLDMLTLILSYSPRSWFQTEVFRSGLKSIAKEFWRSFLGYTTSVSSEAELMSWSCAFNYHAKRRRLRCALEFTSTEQSLSKQFQLKFTLKTPKRKRSAMFSDGEQDELNKILDAFKSSTSNDVLKAHEVELKRIFDAFKSLNTSSSADGYSGASLKSANPPSGRLADHDRRRLPPHVASSASNVGTSRRR